MPIRPKRPCRHFGCGKLTDGGYCEIHRAVYQEKQKNRIKESRERYDKKRLPFRQRGYSARWDRVAKNHLHFNPLCVMCADMGRTVGATVVDHVVPHKEDAAKMWGGDLQGLCASHHSQKTARVDGGYGNRRRDA